MLKSGRPYSELARAINARDGDGEVTGFPTSREIELVGLADDLRETVAPAPLVSEAASRVRVPQAGVGLFGAIRILNPRGLWLLDMR
ncbi:unnamed protein product, partial [marine sediment metagenome]